MAEIIDLLTPSVVDRKTFIVNTAVDFVTVSSGIIDMITIDSAGIPRTHFVFSDNYTILSVGYLIPEIFRPYFVSGGDASIPVFTLYNTDGISTNVISEFGSYGTINLIAENYELSIGTYVNVNVNPLSGFVNAIKMQSDLLRLNISMLNVPAVYDGKEFQVIPFVKVLHSLPMQP